MWNHLAATLSCLLFSNECALCPSLADPNTGVCRACGEMMADLPLPSCSRCGRPIVSLAASCTLCGTDKLYFDRALACVYYENKAKEALHAYKFGRKKALRTFFSSKMRQRLEKEFPLPVFDAIAAVPLAKRRQNERGFNQAGLLAADLSKHLNCPDRSALLSRKAAPVDMPQARLAKMARHENVRGMFRAASPVFKKTHVLLIDDILTTGQTASECAKALKEAGAASVTVLVFARGR